MTDNQPATVGHTFTVRAVDGDRELDIYSPEGYAVLADLWLRSGWHHKLSYEVTWLGIPIIQLPEDIVILQELLWKVRPTVVVESGVAHGGALILYASILEMLGRGRVIGIDVEIRKYNRLAIESHPLSRRIHLIEGSSVDPETVAAVTARIEPSDTVMVMLDSNHTRDHVRAELEHYAPFVTPDSFLVVFDSVMERVQDSPRAGVGWDEDNPLTATYDFLAVHPEFERCAEYERLGVTYCHGGFLRRRPASARLDP